MMDIKVCGARMRVIRIGKGVTVPHIAKLLGLPYTTIRKADRGLDGDEELYQRIAEALGEPAEAIIGPGRAEPTLRRDVLELMKVYEALSQDNRARVRDFARSLRQ